MPIQFKCPKCARLMQTPDGTAGKQAKCPDCEVLIRIPGAATAAPQPKPARSASPQQRGGSPRTQGSQPQPRPAARQTPSPVSSSGSTDVFGDMPTSFPASGTTAPRATAASNPYAGGPGNANNPYAAPGRPAGTGKAAGSTKGNPVYAPAIILVIMCVIHFALLGISLVGDILFLANGPPMEMENQAQAAGFMAGYMVVRGIFYVIIGVCLGLVTFGSISAMKLRREGFALTGFIISMIPCIGSPLAILGIPFGIWGLIAHNKATAARMYR